MSDNLPVRLSHAHVTMLRDQLHKLASEFAAAHNLYEPFVQLELGFVAAHYAAQAGVLNVNYQEWIDARRDQTPAESCSGSGDSQSEG